jgi:hypothetical protein
MRSNYFITAMPNYNPIFENEAIDYIIYRELIDKLLAQNKTTGPDNSEAMLHYTKLNVQRMNRVEKTIVLTNEVVSAVNRIKNKYRFLVISEGWCGDASQIVPVIYKIAALAPELLDIKIVLRDQHPDLIDAHLTNGGRAIPVLLVLDEKGELVLPKWGPRPQILQNLIATWKEEGIEYTQLAEKIHGWYAKDRTQSTQDELALLLEQLP